VCLSTLGRYRGQSVRAILVPGHGNTGVCVLSGLVAASCTAFASRDVLFVSDFFRLPAEIRDSKHIWVVSNRTNFEANHWVLISIEFNIAQLLISHFLHRLEMTCRYKKWDKDKD